MSNIRLIASHPWFLVLFAPAIALLAWTYLKATKKYRRTRNRVVSLILLSLIMIASINLVAGVAFEVSEENTENEIFLLVDVSYSNQDGLMDSQQDQRDNFIKSVLDQSQDSFKVGIITFAKDAHYVAELSYDLDDVFNKYKASLKTSIHDNSSTNIASALLLAEQKINEPQSTKLVVISDGHETDGNAVPLVVSLAARGVRIDSVVFDNQYAPEIQINDVTFPQGNIEINKEVTFNIIIQNSLTGTIKPNESSASVNGIIKIIDNGKTSEPKNFMVAPNSVQPFPIEYTFTENGPHEICFVIQTEGDKIIQNNYYYSYIYIDTYEKILILEKFQDESQDLYDVLSNGIEADDEDESKFLPQTFEDVEVRNIDNAPKTLRELRDYDMVILVNVANKDFPSGFDEILNTFVKTYGGGLLTVGGDETITENGKDTTIAHSYDRKDMNTGSVYYRSLLPVNCIDYTPPLALAIVVDCSQSMDYDNNGARGKTRLDLAKDAAEECVKALSERDYCAVIAFGTTAKQQIGLTPKTKEKEILSAIWNMDYMNETYYGTALTLAYQALDASVTVENKHIIFITDGVPGDGKNYTDESEIINQSFLTKGITLSTILISESEDSDNVGGVYIGDFVRQMSDAGRGNYMFETDASKLPALALKDLKQPSLQQSVAEEFNPAIRSTGAPELVNLPRDSDEHINMPALGGFYGTKPKVDESVEVILADKYVPIYARWKTGEGRVGSFMSSFSNDWGQEFLSEDTGIIFLFNMIRYLTPSHDIRSTDIEAEISLKNYSADINIVPLIEVKEEQKTILRVSSPQNDALSSNYDYTQKQVTEIEIDSTFKYVYSLYVPGTYKIEIEMIEDGVLVGYYMTHISFSYSQEYNVFYDKQAAQVLMSAIAENGKGNVVAIDDSQAVLNNFNDEIIKTYDPWLILIITTIVLFLLNVAVRKFKWRWPHEIIKSRKAKAIQKRGV